VSNGKKDRYKRLIAEVYCNNININKELVKNGLAWHFKKYSSDNDYAKLEIQARKLKVGLWQQSNPIAPWNWRKK
jgi:endonuclease YncB( thermonuclease family)